MIEGIEIIQRDVSHTGYHYQKPTIPLELPEEPREPLDNEQEHHHQPKQDEDPEDELSVTSRTSSIEEDHSETHEDGQITNPPQDSLDHEHHHENIHHNDISNSYLPPEGSHFHHYLPPKNNSDHIQLETKPKTVKFLYKFDPNGKKKIKRQPDENLKNISDILKKINKNKYLSSV